MYVRDGSGKHIGKLRKYKEEDYGAATYTPLDKEAYEGEWWKDAQLMIVVVEAGDKVTYKPLKLGEEVEEDQRYKYMYDNRVVYEGDLIDGRPRYYEGRRTHVYENGDVYTGRWRDHKRHGEGRMVYNSWPHETEEAPPVYDGDWVDDERHGKGKFTYKNGDVYDGSWKKDYMTKGKYHADGVVETWSNGKKTNTANEILSALNINTGRRLSTSPRVETNNWPFVFIAVFGLIQAALALTMIVGVYKVLEQNAAKSPWH